MEDFFYQSLKKNDTENIKTNNNLQNNNFLTQFNVENSNNLNLKLNNKNNFQSKEVNKSAFNSNLIEDDILGLNNKTDGKNN